MEEKNKKPINRRDFIKIVGISAATSTAVLYGCSPGKENTSTSSATAEGEVPTDKMTHRDNPTSGDRVSLLGYGCMRWPTKEVAEGSNENVIDQDAVNELVDYAIAHGVNYFDTAPVYVQGFSERSTGIALKRHPREKFFIATKLSNFAPSQQTREGAIAMYRNSFKELQVDYIDYLLLHSVGGGGLEAFNKRYIDNGVLDFLLEERKAGHIRNLGFSYHGEVEVYDWLLANHDKYKWDFVQIQLNYVDWKHANETNRRNVNADYLYDELNKRGIPAVIMEPLLGGRLSKLSDNLIARFKERSPGSSVASWAFRFAGSLPNVLTVLSGMTYMEHLQDNIRTYSPLQELTDEEKEFLEETARLMLTYPTIPCNDCDYCMPCPYGLDIPAVLLHYNRCVNAGDIVKGKNDSDYARARRAFLVGYDRSVPKLRQASHCIDCKECVPHCPQNINIPREMRRIDAYVEQLKQGTLE
ncbi:MAG: aldo/keto reductase [Mediterranea sp.]|jgi:predicted aldo/keto reductase-like oxidoreductase|nr:aldo/keto reductase [Mediterranea sp.]